MWEGGYSINAADILITLNETLEGSFSKPPRYTRQTVLTNKIRARNIAS